MTDDPLPIDVNGRASGTGERFVSHTPCSRAEWRRPLSVRRRLQMK